MAVFGDYVNGTVGTSETKVGTINVPAGSRIISIVVASRSTGMALAVRLDYAGIKTPKKFLIPSGYGTGGTVAGIGAHSSPSHEIPIDEEIPVDKSIDVYAISDTASTSLYVGLKWVNRS